MSDREVLPVEVLRDLMGLPAVLRIWWPMWLQNREEVVGRVLAEVAAAETVIAAARARARARGTRRLGGSRRVGSTRAPSRRQSGPSRREQLPGADRDDMLRRTAAIFGVVRLGANVRPRLEAVARDLS